MKFLFKKKKSPIKEQIFKKYLNPERDWLMLLLCFSLVLVLEGLWGGFMYRTVVSKENRITVPEGQINVDEKALLRVVSEIAAREDRFQEYASSTRTILDPSLAR